MISCSLYADCRYPSQAINTITGTTVPVPRDVVENMLMQRFHERVDQLSDAELAQLLENIISSPADSSVRASASSQILQNRQNFSDKEMLKQIFDYNKPDQDIPQQTQPNNQLSFKKQEDEEEIDDTAKLFQNMQSTRLSNPSNDSSSSDANVDEGPPRVQALAKNITIELPSPYNNDAFPMMFDVSEIAKLSGICLGVLTSAVALVFFLKKSSKDDTGSSNSKSIPNGDAMLDHAHKGKQQEDVEEMTDGQPNGRRGRGWLAWLLANTSTYSHSDRGDVQNHTEPSTVPGNASFMDGTADAAVPWRKKGDGGNKVNGLSGQVLWKRREDVPLGPTTALQQGNEDINAKDLWRMPMSELQGLSFPSFFSSDRSAIMEVSSATSSTMGYANDKKAMSQQGVFIENGQSKGNTTAQIHGYNIDSMQTSDIYLNSANKADAARREAAMDNADDGYSAYISRDGLQRNRIARKVYTGGVFDNIEPAEYNA